MKKWMLVACVALLGLAQASDRIVDGDQDQEVGRVTPPTTSVTPMAGSTDTTEEWPPLDVRYKEPLGFYWPDNSEAEIGFCVPDEPRNENYNSSKTTRFFALALLIGEGKSSKEAVDIYLGMTHQERSNSADTYFFGTTLLEINLDICEAADPVGKEKLKGFLKVLYAAPYPCESAKPRK